MIRNKPEYFANKYPQTLQEFKHIARSTIFNDYHVSCYFRLFIKMSSTYFFFILIIIFSTIIIHLCGSDIIPSIPPLHSSPRSVESPAKASLTSTHSGSFFFHLHQSLSRAIALLSLLGDFNYNFIKIFSSRSFFQPSAGQQLLLFYR